MALLHINTSVFLHLLLLVLSLFPEFFLVNCNIHGHWLQAESSALLQLKQGFTSGEFDSWLPRTNYCIWEGVICDESRRVIGLDLSFRNITGTISTSLFNLTSLRILNFAANIISIPYFGWEKLSNLSRIDLSYVSFNGMLPVGISRLTKLTSLDLSFFNNGTKNFSYNFKPTFLRNMSNLRELSLDGLDLSAYGNEWCRTLVNSTPALEALSMHGCSLFGASCSYLSKLPFLSSVALGNNNLDFSIVGTFINFTSLSSLDVSENDFKGLFPEQIFQLRNLHHLDISMNLMLSGSLLEFSKDHNLEDLDLSQTNFSGKLPNTIGNLKFFTFLDLSNCHFFGRIPPSMENLSSLMILNLSENNLQGHVPKELFHISGIRFLSLASNNFNGHVDLDFIKDLKNLWYLDLSNSGLSVTSWDTKDASSFSSYPNISALYLAGCNMITIPTFIKYQHSMQSLDLSNNKIHGEIPSWLWRINTYLNLSCNFFSQVAESSFSPNTNPYLVIDLHSNILEGPIPPLPLTIFEVLDFSNNHFTTFISFNINSHQNSLRYLFLANNSLAGEIPLFICNMSNLLVLDLSNNRLTGSIPSCLLKGANLQVLKLRGNQLHGAIPQEISPKCELLVIDLRDNQLDELIPMSLSNCQPLEILDLGNNNLNDTFPYWLGNMSSLRVLILRSNKFHGKVGPFEGNLERNYTFSMLHVLDISFNNFSGKLCAECFNNFKSMMIDKRDTIQDVIDIIFVPYYYFGLLTIMNKAQQMTIQKFWMIFKSIDFSNNLFEGEIPTTIGQLISLQVLNMSNNYLTGKIIPQLGHLSQLVSLDLSMNSLSGEIPQELASLDFLEYLNLSYNKLVGNIPVGGQFSTFSNTSFEGNDGLCLLPCDSSVPVVNNTAISSDLHKQAPKSRSYMIILGILFGVGFGGSMAVVVVLDVMFCGKSRRRRARRAIDG